MPSTREIERLAALLQGRTLTVMTGAGCSTESGIPDYRGPQTRHKPRQPILYAEFVHRPEARRRYWARSMLGWGRLASAAPNAAHRVIAAMEHAGCLKGLITQNVDRLHHVAGSRRVIELHGALAEVRCLSCQAISSRDALQRELVALNPQWRTHDTAPAPDGDAELDDAAWSAFVVPECQACGGMLKPNVVFFGENVPRPTVDAAFAMVDQAEVFLIVGSSLTVWSGFRFVRHAAEHHIPVVMINLGPPARGGELLELHVDAPAGATLEALSRLDGRWRNIL